MVVDAPFDASFSDPYAIFVPFSSDAELSCTKPSFVVLSSPLKSSENKKFCFFFSFKAPYSSKVSPDSELDDPSCSSSFSKSLSGISDDHRESLSLSSVSLCSSSAFFNASPIYIDI